MHAVADQVPNRVRTWEFSSDDVDESVDFVTRNFGPHSRVPREQGPLGLRYMASVGLRGATGSVALGIRTTIRAAGPQVLVHLPLQSASSYRVGRRTMRSTPEMAVLLAPGHDYTLDCSAGPGVAFQLEPSLVEEALRDRGHVRAGAHALSSIEIPVSRIDRESLVRLVEQHRVATSQAQHGAGSLPIHDVEYRLASWLIERIMAARGFAALSPSSRLAAERVDAWIRDHVAQPITLEQLSSVAGVVGRTLQEACKARWGQTPLELVAARRLEHVRTQLATDPVTTVTEAAVHSGFTHLGRFSATYRQCYGESPSETLARTRIMRVGQSRRGP